VFENVSSKSLLQIIKTEFYKENVIHTRLRIINLNWPFECISFFILTNLTSKTTMLSEKPEEGYRASTTLPVNSSVGPGSNIVAFSQRAHEVSSPSFSCSAGLRPVLEQADSRCDKYNDIISGGVTKELKNLKLR
jgi:hypothetical protein